MSRVGAVILAGGASTRLGVLKQLVRLGTETLLERSVRVAVEAGCSPVIVVLGASGQLIQSKSDLRGVHVIVNDRWSEGMASSIRRGVMALPSVDGAVLMTCDMPSVTSSHLRALALSGEITGSSYAGRHGVPAYLPQSSFSTLMTLEGDTGAKLLLKAALSIELVGGELDIDTAEDLRMAQERLGLGIDAT